MQPACLKDEGCHCRDREDFSESERTLMKIRNRTGPRILPWGTAALMGRGTLSILGIPFRTEVKDPLKMWSIIIGEQVD